MLKSVLSPGSSPSQHHQPLQPSVAPRSRPGGRRDPAHSWSLPCLPTLTTDCSQTPEVPQDMALFPITAIPSRAGVWGEEFAAFPACCWPYSTAQGHHGHHLPFRPQPRHCLLGLGFSTLRLFLWLGLVFPETI